MTTSNGYRARGKAAFGTATGARLEHEPHEAEDRMLVVSPDPGHTAAQMADQLVADPEFVAWQHAELRGLIGRR